MIVHCSNALDKELVEQLVSCIALNIYWDYAEFHLEEFVQIIDSIWFV